MKKSLLLLLTLTTFLLNESKGQAGAQRGDTMTRYYARMAKSTNEADKAKLETQLYELLKSEKESDWLTARRYFFTVKKPNIADSITKAVKVKFPTGQVVRDEQISTVYNEKDPVKKEKLYKEWIAKFPPEKFGSDRIQYDYARNAVSGAYAEADNVKKAVEYADMIETPVWKGEGWASAAQVFRRKGNLKAAEPLYKKAVANSYKYMTTNRNDPGAGFAISGFTSYSTALGGIYVEQKRYKEAYPVLQLAHDSSRTVRADVNSLYSEVLIALDKHQQAFDVIDEAVKAGQATAKMKESLKTLYVKVKGSDAGFNEYISSVNKAMAEKIRMDLARQMINQPAPGFSLKDVDGNLVSLADLKGKIVIIDFWATWCGPCKKSFPSMKAAMEKFQNNPDVKFLYIHTWEKEAGATDSAKSYVTRSNFPFHVLMDLKNADGLNAVVESYKVTSIPTKFVIDKEGRVRFRFSGFSAGEDAAIEEIVAMVELASK